MATKSHTENFLIFRSREIRYPSKLDYEDSLHLQENGSIPLTKLGPSDHETDEAPEWILKIRPIERSLQMIQEKLSTLESLHKENLITRFGDDKHKEKDIQTLTRSIAKTFSELKDEIKSLTKYSTNNKQEKYMKDNIQSLLATKLRDLSLKFHKSQNTYLINLQKKDKKDKPRVLDILSDEEEDDEDEIARYDTGFTFEQQLRSEMANERITQREKDIQMIAQQTNEIAEMFEDIAQMVNEQGTLFDRIDYNIEAADHDTKVGVDSNLRPVVESEGTFSKKLCFLLILIIIAGGIVVGLLAAKKR